MTDAPTNDTGEERFDRAFPLNADSPHAQATLDAGERVRFYLVDAIGLDAARLTALLPTVLAELAEQGLIPVFVTDLLDYAPLRDAGVIFEAVAPIADSTRLAPQRDWAARQAEVVEMIRAKWQPSGEVRLGTG
ncbi:hypothetical protein [Actibacterium ureilyticum]|uniref:hypothetical protein n=1 Tax=Actibacterium ureilyticum TaxID=1590614 RepID=UPI000BAAB5E0|nr:hypothetical protein [Actibacterium ureilyticum]